MERQPTTRELLGFVLAGGEAFDAQADEPMTRRFAALMSLALALGVLGLLPFDPPDGAGTVGWVLAGAVVTWGLAAAVALLRVGPVPLATTFVLACAWVAGLGALAALSGGAGTYTGLLVLPVVFAASAHRVQRSAAVVGLAVLTLLPALSSAGPRVLGELGVEVFVWVLLGGFAAVWSGTVRLHRRWGAEREDAARTLARVDPLTGLGNRRAFDEVLARELGRAERRGEPLSLVVCDLNGFKRINDVHGHLAGDVCLRQVAAVLAGVVRRPDAAFRWGGDEFAVLLPDTAGPGAAFVAARIAAEVFRTCSDAGGAALTIGVGTAEHVPGTGAERLLARADAALFEVKDRQAA